MNHLKIFLFFILFILAQLSIAQRHPSENTLLSQSTFTQWTSETGLASSNITSAIRDRNGFVWITSYGGIMRFDGSQVYLFDETNLSFAPSGAFYTAYEDTKGTLWFTSQNDGIITYRNNKFEQLDPGRKILPKSIRCLLLDDSIVWVGANNFGLYKIKNGNIERIEHERLSKTTILEMAMDSKRNLWIATAGEGLFKYDGHTFQSIPGVSNPVIYSVCATPDDHILIGTLSGLDIMQGDKLTHYSHLKGFQVSKVICDKSGRVWIGSGLGLGQFTLNYEEDFSYIGEREGFPMARINFLNLDYEDNLWVSTGRNGLIQLRESNIVTISKQQGLESNNANIIYESADHTFYIGCDGGQLDFYKDGNVKPMPILTPIHNVAIRDIYIDAEQNMWIASYKGLIKKTKYGEKLYGADVGMASTDLRRILPADDGSLWLASRSGGLMKFNQGKVTETYNKLHLLESNYVLAVEKDGVGNLYVGTHSGGMSVLRTDGTVNTFHIEKDDAGVLIFNINIDNEDKVWVVSTIGLLYFDGQTFKKIKLSKMVSEVDFFDWIEDKIGNVWITSNKGVFKIRKDALLQFLNGKIAEVPYKLLDDRDGMKSKECTAATRGLLSASGKIWVPTVNGVSVFYPKLTNENKIIPPVYITSIVAEDKKIDAPYEIEPGKIRYKFSYTAPTFIAPQKVQFKYKLDKVDENWIAAGSKREAEYTNLAPGNYTFRVTACNSDGYWNEQGASINFVVKPFFYQTKVFYVLLIILGGSIFYAIYKWRVYTIEKSNLQLKKVNAELDQFVYSASHDLRAPLASVLGLVNIARLDKEGNVTDYLNKIEASISKLDGFIRDIIDFSRNARVELEVTAIEFEPLINELYQNLKYLDEHGTIKWIVNAKTDGAFYSDQHRLNVVLSNLISNAFRYYNSQIDNPFIEIDVTQNSSIAEIHVKDNGIGIAPQHIQNIFKMFYRADVRSKGSGIGLYIVKETLDKIRGEITVQSDYGVGSTFTIKLHALEPPQH
ncbi:MAG: GHKL domain-containing protein [Bacteroidetes bacterium]|nr:GHKL domain-containing protein [Bacteroidota bacterium]